MGYKKKKILVVFGTRPEAIKLISVITALRQCGSYTVAVCVTSQHEEMLRQVLDIFDIKPEYNLKIMKKNQSVYDVTVRVLRGMERTLQKASPDLIVVQGDTTTAFAVSLAAFYARIPIAHVEAGLRTYHKYTPFPEEINRVLISHIADIHFAPTTFARENLIREGIDRGRITVTGNTAIDALLLVMKKNSSMQPPSLVQNIAKNGKKIILVTGHRRESFGRPLQNICRALKKIAERNPNVQIVYPVHLNPNVRKPVFKMLGGYRNIYLVDHLDYRTFVWLMYASYIILTDSGGIQEEAPSLGKPVLVMRDVTERPEGVRMGVARLVGTDIATIVRETERLLQRGSVYKKMVRKNNPYGDGTAARLITDVIRKILI